MSKPTLYYHQISPPARAAWFTVKAANIDADLKRIDIFKGEQKNPEFIKINPAHTVPTLDDNGFYLWESRAIMAYICDKYGKVPSLYPKDLQKRATITRLLCFDQGTLFSVIPQYIVPIVFAKKDPDAEKEQKMKDALDKLDSYIEGPYITGSNLTIADLTIWCSISFLSKIKYDISKWENIKKWDEKIRALPYFNEVHGEFLEWCK